MTMNIAFAKIGTSITFDKKKWNSGHGRCEAVNVLFLLADSNPDMTFYIIGKSDFDRAKPQFKHNNVINVWSSFDKSKDEAVTFPAEFAKRNNISFEYGIIFSGPAGYVNMPNRFYKKDGNLAKVLQSQELYAGPILYFLNETKIPWSCLTSDNRYIPLKAADLFNQPVKILTQVITKDEVEATHYIDYLDKDMKTAKTVIPIEKINIMHSIFYGKEKPVNEYRQENVFSILLTQANRASRPKLIKECLNVMGNDIEIYGGWDDEILQSSPAFKGAIHLYEIKEKFSKTKYSYVEAPDLGWETPKVWEMIECNTLPFLDFNYYRIPGYPEYLYVKSFTEMKNKISELENDYDQYVNLKNQVYALLVDDIYTNETLGKQILNFK